jgi:hypothetical protein
MWWRVVWNGNKVRSNLEWVALAITRFFGKASRMTNLLFTHVPTITITYPDLRSQIPRYALNDIVAGRLTGIL